MKTANSQEVILKDVTKNGKDRNWQGRKLLSLKLADVYEGLGYKERLIERVRICGDVLQFIQMPDNSLKLYQAYFCKNKLCPMCNWRKAMKYSWQTSVIVDEAIKREPKGRFLFLTLTVRNVEGSELKETVRNLTKVFNRLFKYGKVKKNLIGFLRSIEVTYNEKDGTYHPHIHVLMMVRPSYFRSKNDYIKQEEWGLLWQKAGKFDYVPMVDIRVVTDKKGKGLKGAVLETAKYPVKPTEISVDNAEVIDNLYKGLKSSRQIGYGGLFKEIKKELNFDDFENGNLVQTNEENIDLTIGQKVVAYWCANRSNYFLKSFDDYVAERRKRIDSVDLSFLTKSKKSCQKS